MIIKVAKFADTVKHNVSPRTAACEECDRGNGLGSFRYVFMMGSMLDVVTLQQVFMQQNISSRLN